VVVGRLVAELGHAGATRHRVVDDHRGQAGVGVARGGQAAHVPAVADGEERQHADGGVLDGVQRAGKTGGIEPDRRAHQRLQGQRPPHRAGAQDGLGQVERLRRHERAG
jgi:hypothetical protein